MCLLNHSGIIPLLKTDILPVSHKQRYYLHPTYDSNHKLKNRVEEIQIHDRRHMLFLLKKWIHNFLNLFFLYLISIVFLPILTILPSALKIALNPPDHIIMQPRNLQKQINTISHCQNVQNNRNHSYFMYEPIGE